MPVLFRRALVVVPPLVLAVVLCWHPAGGDEVFNDVRDDIAAWKFVHVVFLLLIPLIGLAAFWLLRGLESRAATVSRASLLLFLVFYTAYEVTVGIGTGILVDYADGLPAAEQAVVADAIQEYNRSGIVGDPASVALLIGFFGWVVAMLAAAWALRAAGAGWAPVVLLGVAAVFAIHPPPIGPIGLVSFAVAAVLIERWRDRTRGLIGPSGAPVVMPGDAATWPP
jgi:hypothetical protein